MQRPTASEAVGTEDVTDVTTPVSVEDRVVSPEEVVQRASRTDGYLQQWRETSVNRRSAWDDAEAERLEVEAAQRGWFLLGGAAGLVTAVGIAALWLWQQPVEAVPVVVEAAPAPVAVEAAPVPAPVAVEAAPAPVEAVPAPVEAEPAPVEAAPAPSGPEVQGARTWWSGDFAWAEAVVPVGTEMAWFDAGGNEVLDRVACDGRVADGFKCYAGRSRGRIALALAEGAQAGGWTVSACQGADCTPIGAVEVAPR